VLFFSATADPYILSSIETCRRIGLPPVGSAWALMIAFTGPAFVGGFGI
jgi:hypothetical protein